MEAWRKRPRKAQQLSQNPSPTTPLRRKRKKKKRLSQQYPALPQSHQRPPPSPCTPGTTSPPPAAPRQRSALPQKHPVLPHLFSTPPAYHTQNLLQQRRHQPLVWRVCHPRVPVTLPIQSLRSHLPCLRAPRILLCTCLAPLAHLRTLSPPQPTLPYRLLGS